MAQRIGTKLQVECRVAELCDDFEGFLDAFNRDNFGDWLLHFHRKTIESRRQFNSVSEAIDSYDFVVEHVGYTLVAWGMEGQEAELPSRAEFFRRIKKQKDILVELEQYSIADLSCSKVVDKVCNAILDMKLSETNSQVVAGAKALHHLLPNLLPPIDRRYTGNFFKLNHTHYSNKAQDGLEIVLDNFAQIYGILEKQHCKDYLSSLVCKTDWATSETKLIDNAIIGYVKKNNLLKSRKRN